MYPDLIKLVDVPSYLPEPRSYVQIWSWARKGVKRQGRIYRLQYIRIGRVMYTRKQWLQDFFEAGCGPIKSKSRNSEKPKVERKRLPRNKRQRQIQDAERELKDMGA